MVWPIIRGRVPFGSLHLTDAAFASQRKGGSDTVASNHSRIGQPEVRNSELECRSVCENWRVVPTVRKVEFNLLQVTQQRFSQMGAAFCCLDCCLKRAPCSTTQHLRDHDAPCNTMGINRRRFSGWSGRSMKKARSVRDHPMWPSCGKSTHCEQSSFNPPPHRLAGSASRSERIPQDRNAS